MGTNLFERDLHYLEKCARILNLDSEISAFLKCPMRELHISIPIRMDDKSIRVFEGFRVQHNDALGPIMGGVWFSSDTTIVLARALGAWATWKTSLLGLPLGGGMGGVVCNPEELSEDELQRLSRGYMSQIWQWISPEKDVLISDVNTTPQIMAWMMDEYSKLSGENAFGCIIGKPICIGGSCGREDATARGGMYTLHEASKGLNISLKNATVAILGFDIIGSYSARLGSDLFGCRIVAVANSTGGIYNNKGVDVDSLFSMKAKTGTIINYSDGQKISNEELLELDVDILIVSALDNVITKENAPNIKAKIILELANGSTNPEADKILFESGVHVIPDLLCNAGDVTVSYFEMVQNITRFCWSIEKVYQGLDEKMTHAYRSVLEASKNYGINMRQAAYTVAISRVVEAMKLRGWI